MRRLLPLVFLTWALLTVVLHVRLALAQADSLMTLRAGFKDPPPATRIMMRWWWFGPSVTNDELERELLFMKKGGVGGVEVQTTYPLALDDTANGLRNYPFLSNEYLDHLRFASAKARELGLRLDLTLGSGWPYGGSSVPVSQAAGMLRVLAIPVKPGESSVALPAREVGEKLLAAFLVRTKQGKIVSENAQRLLDFQQGRLLLPSLEGLHAVLFFVASRTGQQVKRPAIGAEGFVLDPYDRSAIESYLHRVGDRLMEAFGSHPPYAIFSDSLEVYGADWTTDFLKEFRNRRGYDLSPYLPALVGEGGTLAGEIRHDWGQTLTELAEENYLTPIRDWAAQHGTRFRSQTYGTPPVALSSNALVDLAEGEGWNWKEFSAVRWASSANHLYGRPVTSSETWTWLDSPVFRATPLDMKAAADAYFLEGSNQLVGHGWPYSPESAGEPGWHFYAAAVFNQHNPWWLAMPSVTRYLQRVSYLLRQGKPANDVALLLPTDDAWARFTATVSGRAAGSAPLGASISVNQVVAALLGDQVIPQILDAGFNVDFIDGQAIGKVGIPYPILVLPDIKRLPLATYRKIQSYAQAGGIVIATGSLPSLAPGLKQSATDSPDVQRLSQQLFRESDARGRFLAKPSDLGRTLEQVMKPDVKLSPPVPGVGFVHRKLPWADLYFLANTTNQAVHTQASFRATAKGAELWDPVSGETRDLGNASVIDLTFEPYQSLVVTLAKQDTSSRPRQLPRAGPTTLPPAMDLAWDWSVTFTGLSRTVKMKKLESWTDHPETQYYSGLAVYRKTIDVDTAMCQPGIELYLDFGSAAPVAMPAEVSSHRTEGTGSGMPRMRAWLDSPVREAAQVFVNDKLAGTVWLPPYEVAVTEFLHAGANQLRIAVGNLAINEMAGQALPDHRLLYDRYGERFRDQDLSDLRPLPSGITGDLRLVPRATR